MFHLSNMCAPKKMFMHGPGYENGKESKRLRQSSTTPGDQNVASGGV